MSNKNTEHLIEYWKKVKDTIHLFDEIIVKYVIQWSAILLAMIGASGVVFPESNFVAGIISLAAIFVSIPIGIKCYFYYELLEEALCVGKDVEQMIFQGIGEKNYPGAYEFGLTHRLCEISTRTYLSIKFFGWTIFLPFIILIIVSSTLAAFYFNLLATTTHIVLSLLTPIALTISIVFLLSYRSRARTGRGGHCIKCQRVQPTGTYCEVCERRLFTRCLKCGSSLIGITTFPKFCPFCGKSPY